MEDKELNRKDCYAVMKLMETEPLPFLTDNVNTDDFEDITAEVFDAVDNQLKDLEMLCADDFNFEETMTSIELMDAKMDIRLHRNKVNETNQDSIRLFESDEQLSQSQKLALMRELLLQFATWMNQVAYLQQTVYSCLYL